MTSEGDDVSVSQTPVGDGSRHVVVAAIIDYHRHCCCYRCYYYHYHYQHHYHHNHYYHVFFRLGGAFLVQSMPCVVLWRPEALDCRVLIPPETRNGLTSVR